MGQLLIQTYNQKWKNEAISYQIAIGVFGLLISIYMFTFNGKFTSIDELKIYAQVESLVQQHTVTTPQIAFANYHNPVGQIEPGFAFMATPFYWLANQFKNINNIYAVMMLNPILIALTASFLLLTARTLGYSRGSAIFAALSYGLGTMAWYYALTLYREPLVGFCWMIGLFGLIRWRIRAQPMWGGIGLICLLFSVVVKLTAMIGVPIILLVALIGVPPVKQWQKSSFVLIGLGALLATIMVGVIYAWRFNVVWYESFFLIRQKLFLTPSVIPFYGLLFSPIKGLFVYIPLLWLTLVGIFYLWQKQPLVAMATTLPLLGLVWGYSTYSVWYGGQSWGARFLVPALPLFCLPLAPLWEKGTYKLQHGFILVISLTSSLLQAAVATNNWWFGYLPFFNLNPVPELNVGLSWHNWQLIPPFVTLRQWNWQRTTLFWFQPNAIGDISLHLSIGLLLFLLIILATIFLWKRYYYQCPPRWGLIPPLLALGVVLINSQQANVGYSGLSLQTAKEVTQWLNDPHTEPHTLITMSNEFHIFFFLGMLKGDFVHNWVSPNQLNKFEPLLANSEGNIISLFLDRVHIQQEVSGKELEWWLNENLYRLESKWVEEYELVRYVKPNSTSWQKIPIHQTFGNSFSVESVSVNGNRLTGGDILLLDIEICRQQILPDYHHLFTHLISDNSQILGHDGPLRYGGVFQMRWEAGDCLYEKRAIAIPADIVPNSYQLLLGFTTPAGKLLVDGSSQAEYISIAEIQIVP